MYDILFQPVKIGGLQLRNRLVMAAMGTNFGAGGGYVSDLNINHYTEKARNGIGLLTVEAMYIHPSGMHRRLAMGLLSDDMLPGLKRLTASVHQQGAAISAQLSHPGRLVSHKPQEYEIYAPSPVAHRISGAVPKEMTVEDIQMMVSAFGEKAARARRAGFDAVEIHGAHGYLIMQFLSPLWNKRTDGYGGSFANRSRFALEVVEAVRREAGEDFPLVFRLSADEMIAGGQSLHDSLALVKLLEKSGVAALHVSAANNETPWDMKNVIGTMYSPPGYLAGFAAAVKKEVSLPVIAVGRLGDPDLAASLVARGEADLICLGRSLYADPEWALKVKEGRPDEIRSCIACNAGCIERLQKQELITCVQNPLLGRNIYHMETAASPKKILVIGAGLAGLETAVRAAQRGHQVEIWEQNSRAGGQALLAAAAPDKEIFAQLVSSRLKILQKLDVKIHFNQEARAADVEQGGFEQIILAAGGLPIIPGEEWVRHPLVKDAWEVLARKDEFGGPGRKAVVVGGGSVGLETAHTLANKGSDVTVIELSDTPGANIVPTVRWALFELLAERNTDIITNARVSGIDRNNVLFYEKDGARHRLPDLALVVCAIGVSKNNALPVSLAGSKLPVIAVGNCEKPGNALDVLTDACDLGLCL
ncbi:MAG: NAD(P)/FAD-dependent oxidoreductase [Desulfarculales bacterium]|jgi:2,4-dienoyl-CoA reductase-like NADH-dependent reductase (Old Yellow Enzyme family)/thioredoxin reductase|nr:NAD(P)/FAD-dependent oxidoreductase [Desulfarculales bacterium]